jgi:hypothetical protein
MSGELPHNLTHQDQRRNVWSPDSEGVIFLTVIVKPYHWSYIHTNRKQRPNVYRVPMLEVWTVGSNRNCVTTIIIMTLDEPKV